MIDLAVEAVRNGQVVGLPTDTVYGIGADPFDFDAVARLFELKGRPPDRPVGVLVASLERAMDVCEIDGSAHNLAEVHWPGALTLVVIPKVVMADWVGDQILRTVGIRVPDHPTAVELLEKTGPLAVTSANRSGGPETMTDEEARAVFGDGVSVYVPGTAPGGEASTVVDATSAEPTLLRKGPVSI